MATKARKIEAAGVKESPKPKVVRAGRFRVNSKADAEAITKALSGLGFEVIVTQGKREDYPWTGKLYKKS